MLGSVIHCKIGAIALKLDVNSLGRLFKRIAFGKCAFEPYLSVVSCGPGVFQATPHPPQPYVLQRRFFQIISDATLESHLNESSFAVFMNACFEYRVGLLLYVFLREVSVEPRCDLDNEEMIPAPNAAQVRHRFANMIVNIYISSHKACKLVTSCLCSRIPKLPSSMSAL